MNSLAPLPGVAIQTDWNDYVTSGVFYNKFMINPRSSHYFVLYIDEFIQMREVFWYIF